MPDHAERVPAKLAAAYGAVAALTDEFCERHLIDEYRDLARAMTVALSRKRASPLVSGKSASWACGIMYALGRINFLFDKTQTPHMRADALCQAFGVSQATGAAKAREIEKALGISMMDPQWTRPSQILDNPMAWMIMVNGLVVDARTMPREIQEEAFRKGLIPRIP